MKYITFIIFFITVTLISNAALEANQFTQSDRERLIRLETMVDEGHKSTQRQINDQKASLQTQIDNLKASLQTQIDNLKASLQTQINDLKTFLFWGFGILFGGMGLLMGFVIWDRRTALEPAVKKNKELEEREEKLEKVIKEYANSEPKLAEILRSVNL